MTPQQFKEARSRAGAPAKPLADISCLDCGMAYNDGAFYLRGKYGDRPYPRCKRCHSIHTSSSKRPNRADYRRTPMGIATDLMSGPKRRSASQTVTISSKWIAEKIQKGFCEATGIPFDLTKPNGERRPFSPSIDQIVPSGGYTKENTQVVCWIYNAAKGAWNHDDVVKMAKALIK